ncbi:MAG: DUF1236 domain-containing protein [Methylocella sp.]
MQRKFGIAVFAALIASPLAAHAQGPVGGAAHGAAPGTTAAGPIGGATGAVGGLLGADQQAGFRDYALREHRSAFRFDELLAPGARLPLSGVTYYPVPPEYGVNPRYRFTIVNGRAVLVDPATRRIVQVID